MPIPNVIELVLNWTARINAPCQEIVAKNRTTGRETLCGSGRDYDCHDPTEGNYFQHRYKGMPRIDYITELKLSLETFPVIVDPKGPMIQGILEHSDIDKDVPRG